MNYHLLASQAAKIMNIPSSEIARLGQIIVPKVSAGGKGRRSIYDFRNLVEMKIVLDLAAFNVPQKTIKNFLANLRNSYFQWLEEGGRDGWIALDTSGKWGAGESLNGALETIKDRTETVMAINLLPTKEFLRVRLPQELGN